MAASATPEDHAAAKRLAVEAGRRLLALRATLQSEGADEDAVRAEGDRMAHEFISEAIARGYPDDAILSEEGADNAARLQRSRVWVVDPLDGTREYGEVGREDWAVHVALVIGGESVAGAVALPARGLTFCSDPPPHLRVRTRAGPLTLVVSRSRPPEMAKAIARDLGATTLAMGSAGAKAMAVILGEADIYLHAQGQYEWDSAAPVAVAAAAGLHVSRLDGSPLRYNRPDPWLPDLLICRNDLASVVLEAINDRPWNAEPPPGSGGPVHSKHERFTTLPSTHKAAE